jgi:Aerotolerance regulator N-terminal/von Willebrand factor type A domain/Beta-galactosidase trimerisation domain
MGFLSPWFLAGVLAVGIPIWVHLIRREQAVRLPFSSLMFLRRIPIKSMSRKRLKYFLLLSMRLAIIVLLALAFARPYFPWLAGPLAGGAAERFGVILLDTSMSMQYGDRWERAKAAANDAISNLGGTEEAQIVTFASDFKILNLPTADKAALRAALEQAAPTASTTSYSQAFRATERIAEDAGRPLSVVLISDLQRAGLSAAGQATLPPVADFRVVNVAEGESPNWTVEGVRSRRTVYRARYPDRLVVQLRGSGTPQATKDVTFTLLGKQIERKSVGIPESGVATVAFEGFDVPLGQNPAEITISPDDQLPVDDKFYFTLERREANRILFLRESGAEAELYYLRSALAAENDSPFQIEARAPADARSVPLREYAMVILSNVRQLPGALVTELRDYVEKGGGILITAGSNTSAALEMQLQGLWPGKTLEKRLMTREGERLVLLGEFDHDHPVFRDLREAGTDSLRSVEVYAYLRLQAGPETGTAVPLRFSNGDPALVEKTVGQGRVMLLATSLDNVWSDFPLHPVFVPLVHQIIRHTAQLSAEAPAYSIPSTVSLRDLARGQGDGSSNTIWTVLGPDGNREIPEGDADTDFLVLRRPGIYEMRQANRTNRVAANPDPRESDLTPLSAEDQALWLSAARAPSEEAQAEAAAMGPEQARRQSVWWYLLLLALAIAAVEAYLANQFLGPKRIAVSTDLSPLTAPPGE